MNEAQRLPLVSVLMFCRNGAKTIRRSIDSVFSQSYPNVQYVVQDGASTDGTVEILRSFGNRIELVSEPDRGTNDGFWRALLRCRGEFIAVCLADEALMPCAIERAVEEFLGDPDLGAVTGDAYLWNDDGTIFGTHIGQPFNFLTYLFGDYCPNFSASFFRRSAFDDIGFMRDRWKDGNIDTVEFEIWCRLGTEHKVKYVPYIFSKYGMNDDQMSHKMHRIIGELDARCMIIDKYLFGPNRFFGHNDELQYFIKQRQFEIIINHLKAYQRLDDAEQIRRKMESVLRSTGITPEALGALLAKSGFAEISDTDHVERAVSRVVSGLKRFVPSAVRSRIPREAKLKFDRRLRRALLRKRNLGNRSETTSIAFGSLKDGTTPDLFRMSFYYQVGAIYRARGQIEQALAMWRNIRSPDSKETGRMACQLMLKLPEATDDSLSRMYQAWADQYARPAVEKAKHTFSSVCPGARVTVAYHCEFWETACARAQALSFIEQHDRSRFRVIGYSPRPVSADIQQVFDEFSVTGMLNDAQFVDRVRHDSVNILVELTGFSPGNRFSAMATRCAPVQVSYLNHTGTSRVANIDYVIADDVAAPPTSDIHYTETIYRLPGSFFCFAFREEELPAVSAPPQIKNGYTTFGCFGGPDKLNLANLRLWATALRQLSDSRLLIQNHGLSSGCTKEFLTKEFGWLGIPPERLILLPGGDRSQVLNNYAKVDISLDTWPYCGGNTIAESLWQGVPVISLRGSRFSSAYGASLISAAGLRDLIANSPEQFAEIAGALGRDSARLVDLRKNLRAMIKKNGFGDSVRFARKLEGAYLDMLARKHITATGPLEDVTQADWAKTARAV